MLALLGTSAFSVTGCNNYGKTELTIDNYLDYFSVGTQMYDSVTFSNNTFIAPPYASVESGCPVISAMFSVKDEKLENSYYDKVKFSFEINYYLNKTSISSGDQPDGSVTYTSTLHYMTFDFDKEKKEYYYVGVNLKFGTLQYYDKSGSSEYTEYVIPTLNSHFESTMYQSCSYLREIKLTSVSGTVESGGLSGMNAHHCA